MERLDGVERVEKGWFGGEETNTVRFDPKKTTVPELVEALKRADTYRRTIRVE